MIQAKKQFRIEFDNVTAFGTKKASTIWYNSFAELMLSKFTNELNAKIIERERPIKTNVAEMMKLKFGNATAC